MYDTCRLSLINKEKIDYSILNDKIDQIKDVIEQACTYNQTKSPNKISFFKKRDNHFEHCKILLQEHELDAEQQMPDSNLS